jgi:hypothetical protein
VKHTHISKKTTSTSNKMPLSLHTLPVEMVYRILDNLDDLTIFVSCRNVCTRLNTIRDTYHRYQVTLGFIMKSYSHHFSSASFFFEKIYYFDSFSCYKFQSDRFRTIAFYTWLYPVNRKNSRGYS